MLSWVSPFNDIAYTYNWLMYCTFAVAVVSPKRAQSDLWDMPVFFICTVVFFVLYVLAVFLL